MDAEKCKRDDVMCDPRLQKADRYKMHLRDAVPLCSQIPKASSKRFHSVSNALNPLPVTFSSPLFLVVMDQQQSRSRRPLLVISARLRQSVSASSELTGAGNGSDQQGRHGSIQFRSIKRVAPELQQPDLTAQKRRTSFVPAAAGSLNCASPRTADTSLSFRRGHLSLSARTGFALASPSAVSGPYIRRPLPHEDGAENCAAVTSQLLHSQDYTCSGISFPQAGTGLNSASLQTRPSLQQGSAPAPAHLPILSQLACKRQRHPMDADAPITASAGVGSCNWDDEEDCDVWDDAVSRAPPQHHRTWSALPVTNGNAAIQLPSTLLQAMPEIAPRSEISRSHARDAEPVVQSSLVYGPATKDCELQAVQRHPGFFIAQVRTKVPVTHTLLAAAKVICPGEASRIHTSVCFEHVELLESLSPRAYSYTS